MFTGTSLDPYEQKVSTRQSLILNLFMELSWHLICCCKSGCHHSLGDFSTALLAGQRTVPAALEADGFQFQFSTLESALADLV